MNKKLIRLTESDLHNIVREAVYRVLENQQLQDDEVINEGWKDKILAGTLGAASMFGNPATANAQTDDVYWHSQNKPNKTAKVNRNVDDLDDVYFFSKNKKVDRPKVKRNVDDLDDVYFFSRNKKNNTPQDNVQVNKDWFSNNKPQSRKEFNPPAPKKRKGSIEFGNPKIIGVDKGTGEFSGTNKWVGK